MTWPLVKPASGYSTLSRFDRDSLWPSISTSWRLAATREKLLAVEIEPDRRVRPAEHAPAAGQRLDEVQPYAAATDEIRSPPGGNAARVIGIADLDVQARAPTFEQQAQRCPGAGTAVPHPVGHELGDEQRHVVDDATRETREQLVL